LDNGEESDAMVDDKQNYGQFSAFPMLKSMVEYNGKLELILQIRQNI